MKIIKGHVKLSTAEANRYKKIRQTLLDKAGWRCALCEQAGRLELHHIRPIYKGGSFWDVKNMQVLCRKCHIDLHRADKKIPVKGQAEWFAFVNQK